MGRTQKNKHIRQARIIPGLIKKTGVINVGSKIMHDMNVIDDGGERSPELEKLVQAIHEYFKTEKAENEKVFVDVILLLSAIMDVPEEIFIKSINRLQNIIIKQVTGTDVSQMVNMILSESKGPIN